MIGVSRYPGHPVNITAKKLSGRHHRNWKMCDWAHSMAPGVERNITKSCFSLVCAANTYGCNWYPHFQECILCRWTLGRSRFIYSLTYFLCIELEPPVAYSGFELWPSNLHLPMLGLQGCTTPGLKQIYHEASWVYVPRHVGTEFMCLLLLVHALWLWTRLKINLN